MFSVKEAAEKIGAAPSSVRVWLGRGKFPGARMEETPLGSYWLIPESDIANFEMGKRGRPQTPDEKLKYPRRPSRRKVE